MSTSEQRRMAEQFFHSGHALYQQGLYNEALQELRGAEDTFRALDARGHPFPNPLSNGISGLANTLALSGHCSRKLGNYHAAVTYYETSLINAKFEKKKPFRTFVENIREDMSFCYEQICGAVAPEEREKLRASDPDINISFRFPYSLAPDVIPFARLYELSPTRHAQYENFYRRAREKDAEIRRQSKTSDDSIMKRMSVYVWSILFIIWAIYGLVVVEALVGDKR